MSWVYLSIHISIKLLVGTDFIEDDETMKTYFNYDLQPGTPFAW